MSNIALLIIMSSIVVIHDVISLDRAKRRYSIGRTAKSFGNFFKILNAFKLQKVSKTKFRKLYFRNLLCYTKKLSLENKFRKQSFGNFSGVKEALHQKSFRNFVSETYFREKVSWCNIASFGNKVSETLFPKLFES